MECKNNLHIPPWLFKTILRIEEQPLHKRLMIPVGGVRNLGKTTGIVQIIRHLASKQKADAHKVRRLSIGLLRESYRQFAQLIETFDEWFDEHDFSDVSKEKVLGYGYKNLDKSPEIIIMERNPDILSLMAGDAWAWDGTYTKIKIQGFSYNKPTADAHMRGTNLGIGWVNEAQTVNPRGVETLIGSIGRPEGKVTNPVMIMDFNIPEAKDVGYESLKELVHLHGSSTEEGVDVYFPEMPAPYRFIEDLDGDFDFEGRKGFLEANETFLHDAPHLTSLDSYELYKTRGDNAVRTNLLGWFGRANSGPLVYTEFERRKHEHECVIPNKEDHRDNLILIPIDFGFRPGVLFSYVENGTPIVFKEFAIENINFYELLTTYIVPYLERHLKHFYENDQIVFIGDPTSGNRREAIKSATPVNVLLGLTDINGDEEGDGERFEFKRTVPSPCGNSIDHRLHCSKQLLSKPNGVIISPECSSLMLTFEEKYVYGTTGTPAKKSNDIYHGLADCFQYLSAYLYAGMETAVEKKKPRKKRQKRNKKKYV